MNHSEQEGSGLRQARTFLGCRSPGGLEEGPGGRAQDLGAETAAGEPPALRAGCRPAEGTASTRAGLWEIKLTQASGGQRKTGTNTLWWFKLQTSGR